MRDYLSIIKKLYFPQCDKKKFNEKDLLKEIESSAYYGQVLILQKLIVKFTENPEMSAQECMGECQLELMNAYSKVRKKLGLKIDKLDLADVMPREVV